MEEEAGRLCSLACGRANTCPTVSGDGEDRKGWAGRMFNHSHLAAGERKGLGIAPPSPHEATACSPLSWSEAPGGNARLELVTVFHELEITFLFLL